jgi:hypothetical protein
MPANQQLIDKLSPHAKRIAEGRGDDYDFLPASLLCAIETNQDTKTLVDSVDRKVDSLRSGLVKNAEEIRLRFEKVDAANASAQREVVKLMRWLMLVCGITAILAVAVVVLLARHI